MSIEGLNLSTSTKCPASCIFCPPERGTKDSNHMKPALVKKLMDEVSSKDFPWKVKSIQVGENGEAFLSPSLILNLRIIRNYMPKVKVNLTTNLIYAKPSQIKTILKEGLLDSLQLNIDGHDAETYTAQKGLPYDKMIYKLKMLIDLIDFYGSELSVGINVLTLTKYCDKVKNQFGQMPLKAPEYIPESSFKQVEESLRNKRWISSKISITETPVFFWAERGMDIDFDSSKEQCPQLPRVETEAFVSPSGWWYPCCLDSNAGQVYGNLYENTLVELHNSEARKTFIDRLKQKQFNDIGYPCSRVLFCKGVK
jgi:MoaA/NifB/PqqE/SkfB family radical SAM enzyme